MKGMVFLMRSLNRSLKFASNLVLGLICGLICTSSLVVASTGAAVSTTRPSAMASSQPGGTVSMNIYVVAVKGLVQVRVAQDQPWLVASKDMVLSEGAELRTGPHSSVTCFIPPDQTFTLDRLGTVRVADAFRNGNKVKTDLLMKYGRTHYDIQSAGLEHEAAITSPSSTLAVRGTTVSLYDQPPFVPLAVSYTGRARFTYNRNTVSVGTKHGSLAKALAGTDGSAETAVNDTVVDPRYAASLTATDAALIATEVARGAVISYNPIAGIPTVSGGRPSYDSELQQSVPGSLDFVLRWTGDANLNLEVGVDIGDPLVVFLSQFTKSEFLYPGYGMQNSASGGHIPYDDIGGPTGGEEIAYWLGPHPSGLYGIGAQFVSGVPTSYTFNIFEYGQPVEMFYFDANGDFVKSTQMTSTLSPGEFGSAIAAIPQQALFNNIPDDPAGNPNPGINPASFSPMVREISRGAKLPSQNAAIATASARPVK
jgi:hypothetical protein